MSRVPFLSSQALALPASLVNEVSAPTQAGSIWKSTGTTSAAIPVPDFMVDPRVAGGLGDGSQDELANLNAAIAITQARASGLGGHTGGINLGQGVWKVSGPIVLPSNVVLWSSNTYGYGFKGGSGAQIQPWSDFGDFLIKTAGGSNGCGLHGIQVFVNSAFTTVSGIQWNTNFGWINHVTSNNSPNQACVINGISNKISDCFFGGGAHRNGQATTLNGGATLPTSTLTLTSSTGFTAPGYATVAGVFGVVHYTGISGNQLTGCTGGVGTASSGATVTQVSWQQSSLSSYTGLGLHLTFGNEDNLVADCEIAGNSFPTLMMLTPQGYGCACYNANGGITRLTHNIFETADTGLYAAMPQRNQIDFNRFEVCSGDAVKFAAGCGFSTWMGNIYNAAGLAQNDTYALLNVNTNGVSNNFVGEQFYQYNGASNQFGTNYPATAILDLSTGLDSTLNQYSSLSIDDSAWISAPWVVYPRSSSDRPDIRAACERWTRMATIPTTSGTGTFTPGETVIVPGAQGSPYEYVTLGQFTQGTLTSITATTTTGNNQVTLNSGGGASVKLGSFITIAGVTVWTPTAAGATVGQQVLAKSGDVLTMSGTPNATVATAAVAYLNSGASASFRATRTPLYELTIDPTAGGQPLNGSLTINSGVQTATGTIAATGALLANPSRVTEWAYTKDLQGVELYAWVSANNVVSYWFRNSTGGNITLVGGIVCVWVKI